MAAVFETTGVDDLRRKLDVVDDLPGNIIDPVLADFVPEERDRLENTPYPPMLPNQRYIRTFRLKFSFRANRRAEAEYTLRNEAPYSGFVVGIQQAEIHQGRWWIAYHMLLDRVPDLTRALVDELESKLRAA